MNWIIARNVRVAQLAVNRDSDLAACQKYTKAFGVDVTEIIAFDLDSHPDYDSSNVCPFLEDCVNVRSLSIYRSVIQKALLDTVATCSTLREVHFINCDEEMNDESIETEVEQTLELACVELQCNSNTATSLLHMTNPACLTRIHVCCVDGSEEILDELATLLGEAPSLKALSLSSCEGLDEERLTELIELCPQVEHLDLSDIADLGSNFGGTIASLKRLKSLNITCVQDVEDYVPFLARCPALTALYCSDSGITFGGLNKILKRRSLRTLAIGVPENNDLDLSMLGNLTSLIVDYNYAGADLLPLIAKHCVSLQHLRLDSETTHKSDFTSLSVSDLPLLRTLELYGEPHKYANRAQLDALQAQRPGLGVVWTNLPGYRFCTVSAE